MTREESIALAKENGFQEIHVERAHNGIIYIKNGKRWIHDIRKLQKSLNSNEDGLARLGYDTDTYYDVITNQAGLLRFAA